MSAAVVAAFGPDAHTLRVVSALRAQLPGTPIVVYAGNRAGLDALASLDQGADVVHAAGANGLREALSRCEPGPVLLTHDDVVFGPDMAARLLRAHAPGRVVVPYLNAPGTGHDLGALRPGQDVAAVLARAAEKRPGKGKLHKIQPSVVLADRDLLFTQGAFRHIAAPGAVLGTLEMDFHAARGAVAAHVAACRRREVPAERLDGRPLLVATLIVRDEEHMLPDCLASLRAVADEIVV